MPSANNSSAGYLLKRHWGLKYLQSKPIVAELIITDIPINNPSPPKKKRYPLAIAMAIKVGKGPKNKPLMDKSIERVSNAIPGTKTQGVHIKNTVIIPIIKPVTTFAG